MLRFIRDVWDTLRGIRERFEGMKDATLRERLDTLNEKEKKVYAAATISFVLMMGIAGVSIYRDFSDPERGAELSGISGLIYRVFNTVYIEPPEQFMRSLVHTPFGMNSFPFGEVSVTEFVSRLSKQPLKTGPYPEIRGWANDNNVYTLHVALGDGELEAIFVHLLSENVGGRTLSALSCRVDGGAEEPGLVLMQLIH